MIEQAVMYSTKLIKCAAVLLLAYVACIVSDAPTPQSNEPQKIKVDTDTTGRIAMDSAVLKLKLMRKKAFNEVTELKRKCEKK